MTVDEFWTSIGLILLGIFFIYNLYRIVTEALRDKSPIPGEGKMTGPDDERLKRKIKHLILEVQKDEVRGFTASAVASLKDLRKWLGIVFLALGAYSFTLLKKYPDFATKGEAWGFWTSLVLTACLSMVLAGMSVYIWRGQK